MTALGRNRRDRLTLILILSSLGAFAPASIAVTLPGWPAIADELGVAPGYGQLTLASFFAMLAASMLVFGPLSDRLGRKPVLTAGLCVYVAGCVVCALAVSPDQLIAGRLVQALGGGSAIVLGRAIVRDLFDADQGARIMSAMVPVAALVPLLAPFLGQWLMAVSGWRLIFVVLAAFGGVCLVAYGLRVPESLARDRRTASRPKAILAAYGAVIGDRIAFGHILCGSAIYAGMMAYVGGSPFAYMAYHGVAPGDYGRFFALGVGGIILGASINGRLVPRFGHRRMLRAGIGGAAACAVLAATVTVLDLGGLPWLVAALVGYMTSCGFVGANAVAGALDRFRADVGVASALFGATQFALGGLANLAVAALTDDTPLAMGLVMASAALLALVTNWWLPRHPEDLSVGL